MQLTHMHALLAGLLYIRKRNPNVMQQTIQFISFLYKKIRRNGSSERK